MIIVETTSLFYDPRNPKCIACKYYQYGDNRLVGEYINQDTKIKHRNRHHNSKACSQFALKDKKAGE